MAIKALFLAFTHVVVFLVGFAGGIYALPILVAPPSPDQAQIEEASGRALYVGEFTRDRKDSDGLHWGEGEVMIGRETIAFDGRLAPGPDYRLYLSPEFVETEQAFAELKPRMVQVGHVRSFDGFVIDVPRDIDVAAYSTAIIWCESFGEFITSAVFNSDR